MSLAPRIPPAELDALSRPELVYTVDDEPPWPDEPVIGARPSTKVPQLGKFRAMTYAEILAQPPEPVPFLLLDIIPEVGLTVLGGPPKVGKSVLASQLGLVVAYAPEDTEAPRPKVLDRTVGVGLALYVAEEGSIAGIGWRLRRQAAGLGIVDPALFVSHRQRLRLDNRQSVAELREWVRVNEPALVILDPLNRLHGQDENRPSQMTPVMDAMAGIAYDYKCAVLAIHHLSKPSAERRGTVWDRSRGATSIRSGTDANLILDGTGTRLRLVGEFRDAEPLTEHLELDPDSLLFGRGDAPSTGKVDPDALLAFVTERSQVTARDVMVRFEIRSKTTALAALDNHPDLDSFEGQRGQRTYYATVQ